jgi:hypothetical protein
MQASNSSRRCEGSATVKVAVRFTKPEELKALPILLRHSPGMVLRDRTYVLGPGAVQSLREAGVKFTEIASDAGAPTLEGVGEGERV